MYVSPLHGFQLLLQLKVLRNLLFYLYQQNKSSESKVKLRQSSNHYKRVLEAAKLAYANITKESITSTPRNLALRTFGKLPILFPTKVNLPYLLYSVAGRYCFLHMIKQNCLLKTILRTLILITQVSFYLFSIQ